MAADQAQRRAGAWSMRKSVFRIFFEIFFFAVDQAQRRARAAVRENQDTAVDAQQGRGPGEA